MGAERRPLAGGARRGAARRLALFAAVAGAAAVAAAPPPAAPRIERLARNPILTPGMLPGDDGENLNGPSLIRVPPWVEGALGRYYLYFAHHRGDYIRLAYADDLAGPWTVHSPGTLQLAATGCSQVRKSPYAGIRHLASPDVHVDERRRQIRMYFHCPLHVGGPRTRKSSYAQRTLVATSRDGVRFEAGSAPLGRSYFRLFRWGGSHYALALPGVLYRSADGLGGFAEGPQLLPADVRHAAVVVRDGRLRIFYTRVGDAPESILYAEAALAGDWRTWTASEPVTVLAPERDWEGAGLPVAPSEVGPTWTPVRQLRDPALFEEAGRTFLLYAVAGESGIAIAEVHWP